MLTFTVKESPGAHMFPIKLLEEVKSGEENTSFQKLAFNFTTGIETHTIADRSCLLSIQG